MVVTKAWEVETEPTINCVLEQIYNLTAKLDDFIADPLKCRFVYIMFSKTKNKQFAEVHNVWEGGTFILPKCY